jgi:hypothetical protein
MELEQKEIDLQIPLIHKELGIAFHLTNCQSAKSQRPVFL